MLTLSETPSSGNLMVQLIIIVILIIINAFFAASELAILSANPTKIAILAEKKNKKAILVQKLQENETKFLSTIQVGITLAGFFSSATAASTLSERLASVINIPYADIISLIAVTLILSYFTLVFGELFPKRIALKSPEKIAMAFARPISIIKVLFKPIVFFLSASCELLVKLFRIKPNNDEKVTEEEIKALISEGVEDGILESSEEELISSIFTFGELTVKNVMTSRINIFMVNINDSMTSIKRQIKENKYTRVPVYEDTKENIIGVLNIKDFVVSLNSNFTKEELREVLRQPLFVSENTKTDTMLKQFQKSQEHLALVIDEVGSVSGLVTLEDIIEEITGNIYDEYDDIEKPVIKISDNTYFRNSLPFAYRVRRYLRS